MQSGSRSQADAGSTSWAPWYAQFIHMLVGRRRKASSRRPGGGARAAATCQRGSWGRACTFPCGGPPARAAPSSLDQRNVDLRDRKSTGSAFLPPTISKSFLRTWIPIYVVDGRRALEPIDDEDALGRFDVRRLHVVPSTARLTPRHDRRTAVGRHAAPASHELVVKTRARARTARHHLPVDEQRTCRRSPRGV